MHFSLNVARNINREIRMLPSRIDSAVRKKKTLRANRVVNRNEEKTSYRTIVEQFKSHYRRCVRFLFARYTLLPSSATLPP